MTSKNNVGKSDGAHAEGDGQQDKSIGPLKNEVVVSSEAQEDVEEARESARVSPFAASVYRGIDDSRAGFRRKAEEEDKSRARSLGLFIVTALLVGGVFGGLSGGALAIWNSEPGGMVASGEQSPATITFNSPEEASQITAVASAAMPSVVTIEVVGNLGAGSGSGVIVSEQGHVLTNSHVVSLGNEEPDLRVTTSDGRLFDAEVLGRDVLSDIAVIKVVSKETFVPIPIANSDDINVGDETIAIGAPLGLPGTVTSGIVSAINRSITVGASNAPGEEDGQFDFDFPGRRALGQTISLPVIQTDASINPGNSGGALLDSTGELIGINVAIASTGAQGSGSIGLGFAIPSNFAVRVATELIEFGTASHGLLGALVTDASSFSSANVTGAFIDSVTPGGAADSAGIRSGDVVTQFNGLPVTNRIDLTAQVRVLPAGARASVTFVRNGNTYQVEVTLGAL